MVHITKEAKWIQQFESTFKCKPSYLVSAPGRVNIVGEHVDHQGYPVFPCAINQQTSCLCFAQKSDGKTAHLDIRHVDPSKYPQTVYQNPEDVKVEVSKPWTNYVVAAYYGIVEYYLNGQKPSEVGTTIKPQQGLTSDQMNKSKSISQSPVNYSIKILVSGDVPPAAGVSSSSSLVVMATMACMRAGNGKIDKKPLADLCANSERYVGTAGGGMDQASIILSAKGSAQLISFNPLAAEQVELPKGGVFVVANTCREAPKAVQAAKMYNKRVFELKTAGLLMLSSIEPEFAKKMTGQELIKLQWKDIVENHMKCTDLNDALQRVSKVIKDTPYTKQEVLPILGDERLQIVLEQRVGPDVWKVNEDFSLFQRVKHVLTETLRVKKLVDACKDKSLDEETQLQTIGGLMDGSGASLAADFECSCPEIDELTSLAKKNGAYGSRLTGAGWGGCTVSLVKRNNVDKFMESIRRGYYDPKSKLTSEMVHVDPSQGPDYEVYLFAVDPADGAKVEEI